MRDFIAGAPLSFPVGRKETVSDLAGLDVFFYLAKEAISLVRGQINPDDWGRFIADLAVVMRCRNASIAFIRARKVSAAV